VPDGGDHQDGQVKLARLSWAVTALVCLLTAVILALNGYYGYAFVTFAVSVAAAINLGP
jgi:membrane protein YdbS with pleckstrin-like domain